MSQPDRLSLLGLRFEGRHGALPGEQEALQPFEVDVVLELDLEPAGRSDDLADGVDYAAVFEAARVVIEGPSRRLIERLANEIAETILARFGVDAVEVSVRKPDAPLPGPFAAVEASVRRERRG